ncbi:efflux RND transporter periplasmic adaptor subunit [Colwelliaceae bacterium BS250]
MIAGTNSQDEVISVTKKSLPIKPIVALVVIAVIIYSMLPTLTQWYSSIPSVNANKLTTAAVIRGELIRDVSVSGKAVAANAPQLYSTEVGKITLLAKPGEAVSLNQVVAQLISPELDALIKQQESTLEQLIINANRGGLEDKEAQLDLESNMNAAKSSLNVAKRERQRADIAYQKQIISEVDWLKSADTLSDAERFYQHAKKRVELAKERLTFEKQHRQFLVKKQQLILDELKRRHQALDIKAPVSGVVGNWLVAQKNTIGANIAIMTIVDLSEYEAELSVPEFYADDIGLGLSVAMQISGVDVSGEIIAISPEIKGNQVKVRAKFGSQMSIQLRQNQRINARIEFEKKSNVLMVKRGAFIGSLAGKFAFKKLDENTAMKIAITTGISSADYIELTDGVSEGEQLIISDYQGFNAAEQIHINN